jgi:hypothetical protein
VPPAVRDDDSERGVDRIHRLAILLVALLTSHSMNALPIDELKQYENKWVALFGPGEEIVGSGVDVVEVITSAQPNYYEHVRVFLSNNFSPTITRKF